MDHSIGLITSAEGLVVYLDRRCHLIQIFDVFLLCLFFPLLAANAAGGEAGRGGQPLGSGRVPSDTAGTPDSTSFVGQSWSTEDGLPSNWVWALEQTDDGALWVGTLGGLARFNGHTFTAYTAARTKGIAGNRIRDLYQDSAGRLWIGTENGLSVRRAGAFHVIDGIPNVLAIDEAPDGTVWFGGRRGIYNVHEDTVESISLPDRVRTDLIHDIAAGSTSVWLSVGGRLWRYRDGEFRRPVSLFETVGGVYRVAAHTNHGVWVAGESHVVLVRDGAVIRRYRHGAERVKSIRVQASGAVWLGTVGEGVLRIEGSSIRSVRAAGSVPDQVGAIIRDASGQWWVGGYREGLLRLRPRLFQRGPEALGRAPIHGVYAGRRGNVWMGILDGGLARVSGGTVTRWTEQDGLPHETVWTVATDDTGTLWVSTENGLVRRRSNRFERVRGPSGAFVGSVRTLYREGTGTLWVASDSGGLYRSRAGQLERVLPADSLRTSRLLALTRDRTGAVWIGTKTDGVARYRDSTVTWYDQDDGVPYVAVRDVHEASDGTIWIATYGGGIARFDGDHFSPVTPQEGLPTGFVHVIHEAPDGTFWLTSNEGVFRVRRSQVAAVADGRRERIYPRTFGPKDGMPARECNGNFQPSIAEDPTGRLWIPTSRGPTVVDPRSSMLQVPDSMQVRITEVRVDDTPRPADSLHLDAAAYRLAIDFIALSLRYGDDLWFRYRLDGGDWRSARSRRTAEYTSLEAGRHQFEVQATLDGETWYSLRSPLPFTVAPPFYETWWFQGAILFLVFGIVGGGYWLRVRALQRRQNHLENLVEARTERLAEEKKTTEEQAERLEVLDAEKSRFFANISHELRTPLSILFGTLEDAIDGSFGEVPAPLRRQMELMYSNVARLRRLTEQLLDLAKLETAGPNLDPTPRDLVAEVRHAGRRFAPLAEREGVRLEVESNLDTHPCEVDDEKLEKIVDNLLSNAIENTPEGGRVTLQLDVADTDPPQTVLRVTDTGRGIPVGEQDQIFKRFAHGTDTAPGRKGTGIGLALAREYAELHGGTIEVDSAPGEGSTFTVRLPLPPVTPDAVEGQNRSTSVGAHAALSPSGAGASRSATDDDSEEGGRRPVLLIVEDNEDVRAYLRRHLEEAYRVVEATGGEEGLQRAREVEPDLIVTDLMMPELDGIELCRCIRKDDELARTPIVLLTARAAEEDAVAGLEAGADAYVTKPFSIAELLARLRRLQEAHWAGAPTDIPRRHLASDVDATPEDEDFLDRVTAAVEDNLSRASFTVEDLAAEVGLSRRQLHRKLKRLTDLSPAVFVRHYRLDVASQLLEQEAGTVAEIAYEVGFGTPDTFAEHFEERFGCPPSAYPGDGASPSS